MFNYFNIFFSICLVSCRIIKKDLYFEEGYVLKGIVGKQEVNFIVDIRRSSSIIIDKECKTCIGKKYDKNLSLTYSPIELETQKIRINDVWIEGYLSKDNMYFDDFQINNFTFLLGNNISMSQSYTKQGYLGLGFSKNFPGVISQIKKKNFTNEEKILLYFEDIKKAAIIFGEFKEILSKDKRHQRKFNIFFDNTNEWYIKANSSLIGNAMYSSQKLKLDTTILDVLIPKKVFFDFMETFSSEAQCHLTLENLLICNCKDNKVENFPSISFNFDSGETLVVDPSSLISKKFYKNQCLLSIGVNYGDDIWVLGISYIKNILTVLDYKNKEVSLLKYRVLYKSSSFTIFLILIIIFLVIISGGLGCLVCKKRLFSSQIEDHNNFIQVEN